MTQEAGNRGAFGVPTMYFGDQGLMFWGSDRFDVIASVFNKKWNGTNPNKIDLNEN